MEPNPLPIVTTSYDGRVVPLREERERPHHLLERHEVTLAGVNVACAASFLRLNLDCLRALSLLAHAGTAAPEPQNESLKTSGQHLAAGAQSRLTEIGGDLALQSRFAGPNRPKKTAIRGLREHVSLGADAGHAGRARPVAADRQDHLRRSTGGLNMKASTKLKTSALAIVTAAAAVAVAGFLFASGAKTEELKHYDSNNKQFWTHPPDDWFMGDETQEQKGTNYLKTAAAGDRLHQGRDRSQAEADQAAARLQDRALCQRRDRCAPDGVGRQGHAVRRLIVRRRRQCLCCRR